MWGVADLLAALAPPSLPSHHHWHALLACHIVRWQQGGWWHVMCRVVHHSSFSPDSNVAPAFTVRRGRGRDHAGLPGLAQNLDGGNIVRLQITSGAQYGE